MGPLDSAEQHSTLTPKQFGHLNSHSVPYIHPSLSFRSFYTPSPSNSHFFGSSFFSSGLGVGKRNESGVRSSPPPTCSQADDPPSKLRNACVSSSGSVTMRFFSSS